MARKRKSSHLVEELFDCFHDLFLRIPAWFSLPLAFLAFIATNVGIQILGAFNPILKSLAAQFGILFAGIAGLVVLLAGFTAALNKDHRRKLYDKQTGIGSIRDLSWREFELLIAEAYRRQGYSVVETGGGGPDGGIDLELRGHLGERVIVQCKQWRTYRVGVRPVRELYGVMIAEEARQAIFVTSGVYTREARSFAEGKNLLLIDGEKLAQMITPCRLADVGRSFAVSTGALDEGEAPACPRCRSRMVRRIARRGARAGTPFWGCETYPKCRGTRP